MQSVSCSRTCRHVDCKGWGIKLLTLWLPDKHSQVSGSAVISMHCKWTPTWPLECSFSASISVVVALEAKVLTWVTEKWGYEFLQERFEAWKTSFSQKWIQFSKLQFFLLNVKPVLCHKQHKSCRLHADYCKCPDTETTDVRQLFAAYWV